MLTDRLEVIDLLAGANLGEHMIFLRSAAPSGISIRMDCPMASADV